MTSHCPPFDLRTPPFLPPTLEACFMSDYPVIRRAFCYACLLGERDAAASAAWQLALHDDRWLRDTILYHAFEEIGFADPKAVEHVRISWGTLRPQPLWTPFDAWPSIAKTVAVLTKAKTGTAAIDLLAYCVYPLNPTEPYQAQREVPYAARKKVLQDPNKALVERLAAAFAMAGLGDPLWSKDPVLADGSIQGLLDELERLEVPAFMLQGINFADEGMMSAPALAQCLMTSTGAKAGATGISKPVRDAAIHINGIWMDEQTWGPEDLPEVRGLPLASFRAPSMFGKAAILGALPALVSNAIAAVTTVDPVLVVDVVLARATRRMFKRDASIASLPLAAALGDIGVFASIGVAPYAIGPIVNAVRPILPKMAKGLLDNLPEGL